MKKLIVFSLALISLASCSKSVPNPVQSPVIEINANIYPSVQFTGQFAYQLHVDDIKDSMLEGEFILTQDALQASNTPWIFELNDYGISYRFPDILTVGTYHFKFPVPAYVYGQQRLVDFAHSINLVIAPGQPGWSNNPIMLPQ